MESTATRGAGTLAALLTLGPGDIDNLPSSPVPGCPGVTAKDLWRSGDLHDALISYQPGASTPGHPHTGAHHHIWVISGSAAIAGRDITAGSYVYVPPGTSHPITGAGPDGCLLLQMHRPLPPGAET